ncbi:hypothetical protein HHI36_001742 [Cryptolaemus montrouzieri]|uniref:Uncharacterized protein n=1 Tax=Cryptolaemus montrouzieri TaxID=559131 RepID=A0ABD2P8I5_9CUCU
MYPRMILERNLKDTSAKLEKNLLESILVMEEVCTKSSVRESDRTGSVFLLLTSAALMKHPLVRMKLEHDSVLHPSFHAVKTLLFIRDNFLKSEGPLETSSLSQEYLQFLSPYVVVRHRISHFYRKNSNLKRLKPYHVYQYLRTVYEISSEIGKLKEILTLYFRDSRSQHCRGIVHLVETIYWDQPKAKRFWVHQWSSVP